MHCTGLISNCAPQCVQASPLSSPAAPPTPPTTSSPRPSPQLPTPTMPPHNLLCCCATPCHKAQGFISHNPGFISQTPRFISHAPVSTVISQCTGRARTGEPQCVPASPSSSPTAPPSPPTPSCSPQIHPVTWTR
ncbi:unnamed protein product [Closterium sp. NIES-54]